MNETLDPKVVGLEPAAFEKRGGSSHSLAIPATYARLPVPTQAKSEHPGFVLSILPSPLQLHFGETSSDYLVISSLGT